MATYISTSCYYFPDPYIRLVQKVQRRCLVKKSMFDFKSSGHSPRTEKVPTRQRKPVKSNGAQRSGSRISALYLYLSTVKINPPPRPSPSHSAIESQSCRFSVKIFSRSALAGGAQNIFLPESEPTVGSPEWRRLVQFVGMRLCS